MPAPGPAADRLARAVLRTYLRLRPRQTVVIEAWSSALDWARPFVVGARRLGAEPILAVEDEGAFFDSLASLAGRARPVAPAALAGLGDAHVYLDGPEAVGRLAGLPAPELARVVGRHDPGWRSAARRAGTRAVRLGVAGITPGRAARLAVDLDRWRTEFVNASTVPPARLARTARAIRARLVGARGLRIRHPNGTDVSVDLTARPAVSETGATFGPGDPVPLELPTGRVIAFVQPRRTAGRWESNRPSYLAGPERLPVHGGRFDLRGGRIAEFEFDRGGEEFAESLARGGRGRDRVAAIVLGANPRVVRAPGLEALAVGAVSLWIGGTGGIGGTNGSPFSHLSTLADATIDVERRRGGRRAGRRNG